MSNWMMSRNRRRMGTHRITILETVVMLPIGQHWFNDSHCLGGSREELPVWMWSVPFQYKNLNWKRLIESPLQNIVFMVMYCENLQWWVDWLRLLNKTFLVVKLYWSNIFYHCILLMHSTVNVLTGYDISWRKILYTLRKSFEVMT